MQHTEESLNTALINPALTRRFPTEANDVVSDAALCEALRSFETPERSLLAVIAREHADWQLSPWSHAVVSCLDECMVRILAATRLERDIEYELSRILPYLAADFIEAEVRLDCDNAFLLLADLIGESALGWNDSLGRSGDNLLKAIRSAVDQLPEGIEDAREELSQFLGREAKRIEKLESRLVATETGKLRAQRARGVAAEIINDAMRGASLPLSISDFLKGPWFGSMQLVLLNHGEKGPEHQRVKKLTETVVWSMQPIDEEAANAAAEKQRLYRIVEDLPAEVRDLLVALEHSQEATEAALDAIGTAHLTVISGESLEYAPFTPLEVDSGGLRASVSKALMKRVGALSEGQWFTFTEGDQSTRIKLVLKLSDVGQLLFTNRNGMKALEKRFDEFAYFMSSGAVKPLPAQTVFSTTLKTYVGDTVRAYEEDLRAQEAADAQATRDQAAREASEAKARAEAAALARTEAESEA